MFCHFSLLVPALVTYLKPLNFVKKGKWFTIVLPLLSLNMRFQENVCPYLSPNTRSGSWSQTGNLGTIRPVFCQSATTAILEDKTKETIFDIFFLPEKVVIDGLKTLMLVKLVNVLPLYYHCCSWKWTLSGKYVLPFFSPGASGGT